MKLKTLTIALCTLMMSALMLTGCDENGLPTDDELQEFSDGVTQFSEFMSEFNENMEYFTEGMKEFSDVAQDIQDNIESATGTEFEVGVSEVVDFAETAGEWSKEVEDVANTLEDVAPTIGELNADVATVAQDLAEFYDKAQLEELISDLEALTAK